MQEDRLVIRPKKSKGDDGYKVFSIRIREEVVDKLENLSKRTDYSRNELIGILLDYALEHCSVEER